MKSKVVIITGGSSGIGFALAKKFLKEGSQVIISGRDSEKLLSAQQELFAVSQSVIALQGDVSIEEDCKKLIDETIKKFGGIDILVNNAGISMHSLFADADLEVLRKLMNINFWGTVFCTKFALPFLLKTGGSVVGISSIAGKIGLPGRTGYSASKFAMEGFLESLRTENLETGLHVLTVSPGYTASNIRKVALNAEGKPQGESTKEEKKMMQPEEVADEIVSALRSRKRELNLTLEGKLAIWMKKFFPSLLDKMILKKIKKEKNSILVKNK